MPVMNRPARAGDGESILTHDAAQAFAMRWAESWNRRDVEAVLAHFHDDVIFTSPTALAVVGSASVRGKRALRDYWNTAHGAHLFAALHRGAGVVGRAGWELAIIYTAAINENSRRVSENLKFDASGLVASAEVFHGVPA
jgi:ketosteroid isomerase-like protein